MTGRRLATRALALLTAAVAVAVAGTTSALGAPKPRAQRPTLSANVTSPTRSLSVTFTFVSATAGASYTCNLDGKRTKCTSPKTYSALAQGNHVFSVIATKTGLRSSPPASFSWTIDRTPPPAVTFNNVPTAPVATSPAITFTAGEAGDTFTCQIDVTPPTTCTPGSTGTSSVAAAGTHVLKVVPTDQAGNVGPSASAVWVVDHTNPSISVSDPPADPNPFSLLTVHFTVGGADAATHPVTCELKLGTATVDGGPATDCTGSGTVWSYSTPDLSGASFGDGTYTLTILATDGAGNQTQRDVTWTRSSTAGAPPVLSGPAAYINNPSAASAAVSWPGTDAYQCSVDSGPFSGCTSPFTHGGLAWAPGTHTVDVKDTTTSSAASRWAWTLDVTPPTLTVAGGPGAHTNATSATFVITASDNTALGTVTCTLTHNGTAGAPSPCPTDGVFPTATVGSYSLKVVAADLATNKTTKTVSWVVDRTAPSGSVSGLGSLVGPISVNWSETVHNLGGGAAAVLLTDTGAVVPTTLSCTSATGVRVSCAGPFRHLRFTPKAHLVPGQHYTVTVVGGGVTDLAGNASAAVSVPFRALRTLEENSVAVVATWQKVSATAAYGHSYVREHLAGAQASYRFRGSAITWWTVTGRAQGKAVVFVDGHKKATIDNYAASTHYRVARRFSRLGAGAHRPTIRVLGVKGARAGTGTFVSVDAFTVGTTLTRTPTLATSWRRAARTSYFAGHAAVANLAGQAVTVVFRGTSVTWYTATGRSQGKARVYVDGVLKATIDNFATSSHFRVARALAGLADRVHTLRIVVTGTHRAGGTGTTVTVDRVLVG